MKKEIKYEEAIQKIQQIVDSLETDEITLDQLEPQLREAQNLLQFCKETLLKTETDVKNLLHHDEE